MRVIKKYGTDFKPFTWLDFDFLPNSDGYKCEIYFEENGNISDYITPFYQLFKPYLDDLLIQTFHPDGQWGDFCIDTWDITNDEYDYSADNKSKSSSSYLKMLAENEIKPEYNGFCICLDWDKFLPIILDCIIDHSAPYSLIFYVPNAEFMFYFHYSGSVGLYYKNLSNEIKSIIERAAKEGFQIERSNDERIMN